MLFEITSNSVCGNEIIYDFINISYMQEELVKCVTKIYLSYDIDDIIYYCFIQRRVKRFKKFKSEYHIPDNLSEALSVASHLIFHRSIWLTYIVVSGSNDFRNLEL